MKEQAGQVTAEAGKQAKQLLSQAQSELTEQAAATQQRVSEGLHALADELTGMAKNSEQDGVATDLARQAADKAHQAAGWLADRDPGSPARRGPVLRPPQARHLPGDRARRRRPGRPVDPRPDRPHRRRHRRQHTGSTQPPTHVGRYCRTADRPSSTAANRSPARSGYRPDPTAVRRSRRQTSAAAGRSRRHRRRWAAREVT